MNRTLINPDATYSREELEQMVRKMRHANEVFYSMAQQTGCHTFIEFCGLQAKFIDICERNLEANVDFAQASVHSGLPLKVAQHDIVYLAEKFECIFGPTFATNPEAAKLFKELTGLDKD